MAAYLSSLTAQQKNNIDIINKEMIAKGITNPYTRAAILAVSSKESNFIPKSEISYKNTANDRIRSIFSKTKDLTDASLTNLKKDDVAFFNFIYGGRYGNASNEGYKYRGRGYNQLTFKDNYASIAKRIGIDIVSNPELANDPKVAAKIMIDYFLREFDTAKKQGILPKYNTTDINGFKNQTDSLNAVFQANRGWNKTGTDATGGYATAESRIDDFTTLIKENKGIIGGSAITILAIAFGLYFLNRN